MALPWHFLYFLPLPQGQGSLRPTLGSVAPHGAGLAVAVGRRRWPRGGCGCRRRRTRSSCGGARRCGCGGGAARRRPRPRAGSGRGTASRRRCAWMVGHHLAEDVEAFLLVLLLRVLLAVAAQADALAQGLHRLEVLDPALRRSPRGRSGATGRGRSGQRELGLARLDDLLDLGPQRLGERLALEDSLASMVGLEAEPLLERRRAARPGPSPRRGLLGGQCSSSDRLQHLLARGRAAARAAGSATSRPRRPGDRACRCGPRAMPLDVEVGAELAVDRRAELRRVERHGRPWRPAPPSARVGGRRGASVSDVAPCAPASAAPSWPATRRVCLPDSVGDGVARSCPAFFSSADSSGA